MTYSPFTFAQNQTKQMDKINIYLRGACVKIKYGAVDRLYINAFLNFCNQHKCDFESAWFLEDFHLQTHGKLASEQTEFRVIHFEQITELLLLNTNIIEIRKNNKLFTKLPASNLLNKDVLFEKYNTCNQFCAVDYVEGSRTLISCEELTGTVQKLVFDVPEFNPEQLSFTISTIQFGDVSISSLSCVSYNDQLLQSTGEDTVVRSQRIFLEKEINHATY